jgi:HD superfamily phosphohydrolase
MAGTTTKSTASTRRRARGGVRPRAHAGAGPYVNARALLKPKVWSLPVSGDIKLWGPEVAVINTPEFERLRHIKQLGTSYLVYPGAVHTRFEHSLGTVAKVQQLIDAVNRNPYGEIRIDDAATRLARMTALLHDVTHIPFGHTLEDELALLTRHDDNEGRMRHLLKDSAIGASLRQDLSRPDLEELWRCLAAKKDSQIMGLRFPFVSDLVSNTVCADLLDYVPRDLGACGMAAGVGSRFLDFFHVTPDGVVGKPNRRRMALLLDKKGMPRPDVASEVLKLLSLRYELAERVYFHHAKNAASVMIGRAVYELGLHRGDGRDPDSGDRNFWNLGDDDLLLLLSHAGLAGSLGVRLPADRNETLSRSLGSAVRRRHLYKIAYLGVHEDLREEAEDHSARYRPPDDRVTLENEVARDAGLAPGDVLVHVPASSTMMSKPADVRVLTERGRVERLGTWEGDRSRRVEALNEAHQRLWRITFYVHPRHGVPKRRRVAAVVAERLGGMKSRYEID